MPDIPIVGQPMQPLFWWPNAIVQCNCQLPNLNLIVLSGFKNASACQKCGKLVRLRSISNQGVAEIDIMIPSAGDDRIQ